MKLHEIATTPAVPGAKNHTGPGSDTQSGANKAKDARTQAAPAARKFVQPPKNEPAQPATTLKSNFDLKDKANADRLEVRLKQQNVQYTRTNSKDGIKFSFTNDALKKRAASVAGRVIDKTKEDPDKWN